MVGSALSLQFWLFNARIMHNAKCTDDDSEGGDMFVTVLLREFGPWIVRGEMRQTKKATLPARFTFSEDTKLCL